VLRVNLLFLPSLHASFAGTHIARLRTNKLQGREGVLIMGNYDHWPTLYQIRERNPIGGRGFDVLQPEFSQVFSAHGMQTHLCRFIQEPPVFGQCPDEGNQRIRLSNIWPVSQ
jgi:hypothetical protein